MIAFQIKVSIDLWKLKLSFCCMIYNYIVWLLNLVILKELFVGKFEWSCSFPDRFNWERTIVVLLTINDSNPGRENKLVNGNLNEEKETCRVHIRMKQVFANTLQSTARCCKQMQGGRVSTRGVSSDLS